MKIVRSAVVGLALLAAVRPAAAADAPRMDCAKLVPAAAATRLFPGAVVKSFQADERTALCNLAIGGDDFAVQAAYLCRPTDNLAAYQKKVEESVKGAAAIPKLGRAAVGDGQRVVFYDDDADCIVEVSDKTKGKKAIDLAKELSAVLKPGLLPAVAAGSYSLPCAKLVPEALLKKWMPGGKVEARYVQANQMECKLAGGGMPLVVNYSCRGPLAPNYWSDFKQSAAKQGMKDVADVSVGTGGVYASMFGNPSINFVDGETGCLVTLLAMGLDKPKALALAADLEKALTAEAAR